MNIPAFLQDIPAPAWGLAGAIVGAIAGAYGTLRATKIANSSSDARFAKQLQHDAEEKSKDRLTILRRDVYLNAVEELVVINSFLGQIASIDPTDTSEMTKGVSGFFKATEKACLVASKRTRKKVRDLVGSYGELFIELLIDASDAHRAKSDMNINRGLYESLNLERARILSAMRDSNENGNSKYKFEALASSYNSTDEQIRKLSEKFTELGERHNEAMASFANSAAMKIAFLEDMRDEVSALLSEDLEVEVDLESMRVITREQSARAHDALQGALNKIKSLRIRDLEDERE